MFYNFLRESMDYILFMHGFFLLILSGMSIILYRKNDRRIPWKWVALYALLQGLEKWILLFGVRVDPSQILYFLTTLLSIASFFCAIEAARLQTNLISSVKISGSIFVILGLFIIAGASLRDSLFLEIFIRYILGFLGLFWVAGAIFVSYVGKLKDGKEGKLMVTFAVAVALYAAVTQLILSRPAFFADVPSLYEKSLFSPLGMYVQLAKTLLCLVGVYLTWRIQYISETFFSRRPVYLTILVPLIFCSLLVCGWLITDGMGKVHKAEVNEDVMTMVRIAAAAVNPSRVLPLTGVPSDKKLPDYKRLKEQLTVILEANKDAAAIYLMGLRASEPFSYIGITREGGKLFFSEPGAPYEQIGAAPVNYLGNAQAYMEGPFYFNGRFVMCANAPVGYPPPGKNVAMLRILLDVHHWDTHILPHRLIGITITIGIFLLLLNFMFFLKLKSVSVFRLMTNAYQEVSDVLELIPDATFMIDDKGVVLFWNRAIELMTGVAKKDIIGKGNYEYALPFYGYRRPIFLDTIFHDDPETLKNYKFVTKKEGSLYAEVWVPMFNNGKGGYLLITAAPLYNKGRLMGAVEIIKDFTERKRMEEKLFELSYIVEQSPSMVLLTDTEGRIEYVNPKFTKMTGFALAEIKGQKPSVLKTGQKDFQDYRELWETITSGREWRGEFMNKKKQGDVYWEFASISAIKNSQGVITHYLKVSEDVTEQKKVEQIKNDFINTVSHELRTPLSSLKEGIAIVLDGSAGSINDEQQQFLLLAKRNVERLHRLINDVLDLQKLRSGMVNLNMQDINLFVLLNEVREVMLPMAVAKGLELSIQADEDLPYINADRDKIIQVLTNLVNNAIKFTPKGSVTLYARKESENSLLVSVRDTGIGIKSDDIDKLFKSFVQVAPREYQKPGSSGLGLSISQEITRLHGGKIWVESEFGKGSSFNILFPIRERRERRRSVG